MFKEVAGCRRAIHRARWTWPASAADSPVSTAPSAISRSCIWTPPTPQKPCQVIDAVSDFYANP